MSLLLSMYISPSPNDDEAEPDGGEDCAVLTVTI